MQTVLKSILFCFILFFCLVANAGGLDYPLVQEEITGRADNGSGVGQSFFLPAGVTIYAIELHVEYGDGSVELNLWRTYRSAFVFERFDNAPEASGVLLRDSVIGMPPSWFRLTLDQPYTNETPYPEELVFDLELLTSGRDGWNNYSFSDHNPYSYGSRVSWSDSSGEYSESSSIDLAFRIIIDGLPPSLFSYYDDGYGIVIDGYRGTDSDVVIPSELDDRPVYAINRSIFHETTVRVTSASVPASVESIERGAFELCCSELTSIFVDSGNLYYASLNGVLFNKSMTTLIRCPDAKTGTYAIPHSVAEIASDAFRYCTLLTTVEIPEGVTWIGNYAFYACSRLATLTLPSGLDYIGVRAFASSGIVSITVPASLRRITTRAFQDCRSLNSVVIEPGVAELSSYIFAGCYALESLTMPSSIVTVGAFTFQNCTKLEALYFEGNAPDLVNAVFSGNPSGFGIYYPNELTGYSGEDWDSLPTFAYVGSKPITGYSRWLARQQLHTATADDGTLPNSEFSYFFGYALNLNLSQSLQPQLPTATLSADEMSMTYFAGGENITYTAEASIDLVDWETISVAVSAPSSDGESTAVVDATGYDECFMRLKIDKSE
jgi:hypothetical protein